jgi:hypothetical protein
MAKVVEGIALLLHSTRYIYDYLMKPRNTVGKKIYKTILQHLGEWK